ncbi:MAG: F0F1 ATP synthase subunit A [Bacillota bacterium]|jgi:F-type H+-transporting ATPase subunit a
MEGISELIQPARVFFTVGPIEINESIVSMWVVMAILIVASFVLTRNFSWLPKGRQNVVELVVDGITSFVVSVSGEERKGFAPYIGTIILFIFLSNTIGIWSFNLLRPPTADVNTTLALGIMSFGLIEGYGIKKNGLWGWIKGLFSPFFLFFPMNALGELARPVSLGFRLFGNIFGGLVIMGMLYMAVPFLAPAFGHLYFDLFSGVLQTFVFTMLTLVAISMD